MLAMKSIQSGSSALDVGLRWTARAVSVFLVGLVVAIFIGEGGFNPLTLTPSEAAQMVFFWSCCAGMREIRTSGLKGDLRKRSRRATAPEVYQ
jgi:hypothetical protein